MLKRATRYLSSNKFEKKYQNRPYQQKIIDQVVDDWYGKNQYSTKINSALIEAPPGAGKTIIGLQLAKLFKEKAQDFVGWDSKDIGVGWVVGRKNLLRQAEAENKLLIQCPDVFYISQFTRNINDCGILDYKHRLLISDESHHEACATMHNIVNRIDPQYMLGLSATPKRTDRAKLSFQKSYTSAGFYTLIDEGWLADFDHWNIPSWEPEVVVDHFLKEKEKWGKSIMYFVARPQCQKAFELLRNAGVRVEMVDANTNREKQIEEFENGNVDVLVNMYVLTEGLDVPTLKTVWVRDSGELPTVQMAGRVLRPHLDLPVVNIVQSVKTSWPFTRTADIANRRLVWGTDGWRRVDKNENLENTITQMIQTLSNTEYDATTFEELRKIRRRIIKIENDDVV